MAKKNYAQQRIGWHRDPRCVKLKSASYKWLNSVLWALCVQERTDTLPEWYDAAQLATEAGMDVRTVCKGLEKMQEKMCGPLIEMRDEKIHVFGVREIHETASFVWKEGNQQQNSSKNVNKNVNKNADKNAAKMPAKVEENRIEEKVNITDTPIQNSDPFFQEDNSDEGFICNHLKKNWKSTETHRKNYSRVADLLKLRKKPQIIKAIDNAIARFDKQGIEAKFRPAFKDYFYLAQDIDEHLEDVLEAKKSSRMAIPDPKPGEIGYIEMMEAREAAKNE